MTTENLRLTANAAFGLFRVLVRIDAVLKVMSRVKMKSYYRDAINAVRPRPPAHQSH